MAGAVAAVVSVVAGAASTVAAVVAPIAATIAAAIAPAVAAIGSVLSVITSALGAASLAVVNTVAGIGGAVLNAVGQTASGLFEIVKDAAAPFAKALGKAINTVTGAIDVATRPILEPIKAGLEIIKGAVDQVNRWVLTAFHPSARLTELKAAHPELWEMSQGYESTFVTLLQGDGIISATEASLLGLPDVLQTINQVATLKVLADLVEGQASVSDLLGAIEQSAGLATAQAIAELSKTIVSTTVNTIDRVDTEVGILRASIDTFDERLEKNLQLYAAQTKTELAGLVVPKLDQLGDTQQQINKRIAAIIRHIDDRAWFAAMLIKILPK